MPSNPYDREAGQWNVPTSYMQDPRKSRLDVFHERERDRVRAYKSMLVDSGMTEDDASAFVYRMSVIPMKNPGQKREQFIAEDWKKRHTYGKAVPQGYQMHPPNKDKPWQGYNGTFQDDETGKAGASWESNPKNEGAIEEGLAKMRYSTDRAAGRAKKRVDIATAKPRKAIKNIVGKLLKAGLNGQGTAEGVTRSGQNLFKVEQERQKHRMNQANPTQAQAANPDDDVWDEKASIKKQAAEQKYIEKDRARARQEAAALSVAAVYGPKSAVDSLQYFMETHRDHGDTPQTLIKSHKGEEIRKALGRSRTERLVRRIARKTKSTETARKIASTVGRIKAMKKTGRKKLTQREAIILRG